MMTPYQKERFFRRLQDRYPRELGNYKSKRTRGSTEYLVGPWEDNLHISISLLEKQEASVAIRFNARGEQRLPSLPRYKSDLSKFLANQHLPSDLEQCGSIPTPECIGEKTQRSVYAVVSGPITDDSRLPDIELQVMEVWGVFRGYLDSLTHGN